VATCLAAAPFGFAPFAQVEYAIELLLIHWKDLKIRGGDDGWNRDRRIGPSHMSWRRLLRRRKRKSVDAIRDIGRRRQDDDTYGSEQC
jgi:hypothetical protein